MLPISHLREKQLPGPLNEMLPRMVLDRHANVDNYINVTAYVTQPSFDGQADRWTQGRVHRD